MCPKFYQNLVCVLSVIILFSFINTLNTELNPIRHLLVLVGAHHILHVNRIKVKLDKPFKAYWLRDAPTV